MKTSKTSLLLAALAPFARAEPLLDSWHTAASGSYARIFETTADETALNSVTTWNRGQGAQDQPTYGGIHEISHDSSSIYIRTTGLGTHLMGPWYLNAAKTNLFPSYPANQAIIYQLPRDPGTPPVNKPLIGLGRIGIFVDGVSMFDSRDAFSYDTSAAQDDGPNANGINGDDVWNRDAFVNESVTFDAANAHQARSNYHYHANPPALRHQLGDSVDYEYLGDFGLVHGTDFDLNEHNGRFCITPEFPEGTFAYFVAIEPDGTPAFPYNIGRKYYGSSTGGVTPQIPANATIFFEGGPETPLAGKIESSDDEITVVWSALEGGSYLVESSSELADWQSTLATQNSNRLSITQPASDDQKFFRAALLDLAPFDDAGFVYGPLATREPNNILLIIVDDWGIDFSALDNPGGTDLPAMPTWESLASQGIRFTNAYAQPTCSPTRANILSGRYSFRHGIGSPGGATFPITEVSLPEAFATASSPYALASFGKWHLGGGDNGPDDNAGWTEFRGSLAAGVDDYYDWDKAINGTVTPVTNTYATSDQVDDAVTFITAQNDNPWFCWLAFNAPHAPFHSPPAELSATNGNSNTARYLAALQAMDTEIARLLESVDLIKTNVFLIGDNGTPGNIAQAPFQQGRAKGTLYEGGIKVPFIALGPDVRARGTQGDLVHCADLFATILDLANIPFPETDLDGRSLLPALTGSGTIEGGVVLENFGNGVTNPGRTIRIDDYKLHLYDSGEEEFYNVATDLSETNNLLLGILTAEEQTAYDALLARNQELTPDTGNTDATGVLSVAPSSGTAGSTVTLTINLDPNKTDPVVPGLDRDIASITLGGVSGTTITRPSRYVAQATFVSPATPTSYPIEVIFTGPQMRTFGSNTAFGTE